MKPLLVLLTLAALCIAGAGCDKPEPQAAPRAFEKAIDGSIPLGAISLDPVALKERPKMEPPQADASVQPVAGPVDSTEPAGAAINESIPAAADQTGAQMATEASGAAGTTAAAQPEETVEATADTPAKVAEPYPGSTGPGGPGIGAGW